MKRRFLTSRGPSGLSRSGSQRSISAMLPNSMSGESTPTTVTMLAADLQRPADRIGAAAHLVAPVVVRQARPPAPRPARSSPSTNTRPASGRCPIAANRLAVAVADRQRLRLPVADQRRAAVAHHRRVVRAWWSARDSRARSGADTRARGFEPCVSETNIDTTFDVSSTGRPRNSARSANEKPIVAARNRERQRQRRSAPTCPARA